MSIGMMQASQKLSFKEFLKNNIRNNVPVIFDGGMGTMIQKSGAISYKIPEDLNFYKSEVILDIHKQYLRAGCNVLTCNSFGANPIKLGTSASKSAEEYIKQAIFIAKKAIEEEDSCKDVPHFVAWDSGQIGKLLEPMGTLTFDEAYNSYKIASIAAEEAGADLAIIETMSDLYEVKAAVLAIHENTSLPVVTTMTFQSNLRTLTGADVLTCVTYLEALHVDILGFNCGGSLEEDEKLAQEFLSYAHIPVCIQPNAGLPEVIDGKDVFKVTPEEFAASQAKNLSLGASALGGCCGTTPSHIKAMTDAILQNKIADKKAGGTETYLCSYNKTQLVGSSYGPVIIGERINPTGKKKCKEALQNNDMQYIMGEAEKQINEGAQMLDVNVGLPGIDEGEMMIKTVKSIQSTFNIPLQLDSSEPGVLEKALRYYNGKALVNSVNGKKAVMDAVFPLIKHYGGAVVALCIDEDGIAPTAEGRVAVAKKIIKEAALYDIPIRDIFIDTLTLTVSSEQKTALETIKAIRILKEEYGRDGIQFVLGVSNISFGLPRRDIMNSRFFMLALEAGLTGCIANPASVAMMDTYRAYRSLSCYDNDSLDYINAYTGTLDPTTAKAKDKIIQDAMQNDSISLDFKNALFTKAIEDGTLSICIKGEGTVKKNSPPSIPKSEEPSENKGNGVEKDEGERELISIIEKGFKDKALKATEQLLKTKKPVEIINNCIVPALDSVGKDFESGKKFLPQLLLSADTVSNSFSKIKESLLKSGVKEESKGTIVIATVYGDIHDIGKNIVRAMLENYGYTVIDLGKNVPSETVVKTVIENNIKLVGLSALMTTTVANMEQTIKDLHSALEKEGRVCKIMVGGAVLTRDYAEKIGADYYAKDAMESIKIAKEVFSA